jgi:hypothetical protein
MLQPSVVMHGRYEMCQKSATSGITVGAGLSAVEVRQEVLLSSVSNPFCKWLFVLVRGNSSQVQPFSPFCQSTK